METNYILGHTGVFKVLTRMETVLIRTTLSKTKKKAKIVSAFHCFKFQLNL